MRSVVLPVAILAITGDLIISVTAQQFSNVMVAHAKTTLEALFVSGRHKRNRVTGFTVVR